MLFKKIKIIIICAFLSLIIPLDFNGAHAGEVKSFHYDSPINSDTLSNGPSFNQAVKIYLKNGEIISFNADWNFGLSSFVIDYEHFLGSNVKQTKFRYQMQDRDKKTNAHINLKFEDILALHLQKI